MVSVEIPSATRLSELTCISLRYDINLLLNHLAVIASSSHLWMDTEEGQSSTSRGGYAIPCRQYL